MVDDELVRAVLGRRFLSSDELRAPALVPPNVDLADGRPFGRFMVLGDLAEGTFGRVVLAVDPLGNRKVALKLLKSGVPSDLERFRREADVVRELAHPNIVQVVDVGTVGEQPYIAMEYVPGTLLRDYVTDMARRLEILIKVARALGHAHARGIIHRDVKPENVLVDPTGEPYLMDFGLARHFDRVSHQLTTTGSIAGTPLFMSPEQASGDTDRVGPASDVFSLGATAYFLFTRAIPFPGARADEVLRKIVEEDPVPPREANRNIPERLESVILKAMSKSIERRHPDAAALADDLEACPTMEPAGDEMVFEAPRPKGCLGWLGR